MSNGLWQFGHSAWPLFGSIYARYVERMAARGAGRGVVRQRRVQGITLACELHITLFLDHPLRTRHVSSATSVNNLFRRDRSVQRNSQSAKEAGLIPTGMCALEILSSSCSLQPVKADECHSGIFFAFFRHFSTLFIRIFLDFSDMFYAYSPLFLSHSMAIYSI